MAAPEPACFHPPARGGQAGGAMTGLDMGRSGEVANDPRVITEIDGAVGRLIVANPARFNAVTLAMWRQIPAAVARLEADPAVRLIVVTGAGEKAFVSGADISEFAEVRRDADSARSYEAANAEAFRALRHAAKPTLAAIRGV